MDIAFKVMKISMYEELVNLWKNNEGIRLSVGDTKDELDKYLKRNRGMSYVCFDKNQNKIAGSILCGHDGRRGYIYHLAVSKKFRKNNIAKSLIERSLSKLKKSGIQFESVLHSNSKICSLK